jgi:hypothetical protein
VTRAASVKRRVCASVSASGEPRDAVAQDVALVGEVVRHDAVLAAVGLERVLGPREVVAKVVELVGEPAHGVAGARQAVVEVALDVDVREGVREELRAAGGGSSTVTFISRDSFTGSTRTRLKSALAASTTVTERQPRGAAQARA